MQSCIKIKISPSILLLFLVLACGLFLSGCGGGSSSPSESPSGSTGSLSGVVQISVGGQASPKDAMVKVQNTLLAKGSQPCYTAVPDENGNWAIYNIPIGTYTVQVFLDGYVLKSTTAGVNPSAVTVVPAQALQPAISPPAINAFTISPPSGPVDTSGVFSADVKPASPRSIKSVAVFSSTMSTAYPLAKSVSSVNTYTADFKADSTWSGTITWTVFAVDSSDAVSSMTATFEVTVVTPSPSPSPTPSSGPTPTPTSSSTPTPTPSGVPTPTPTSGPSPLGTWESLDAGLRYQITESDIKQDVYYGGQWNPVQSYSERGLKIRFVNGNSKVEVYQPPFTDTIQTFEVGPNNHLWIDGFDTPLEKI